MSTPISTINDLIEILKDGQEGFRTAAEDVHSSDLKELFSEFSLQRSKFAGQLQELARSLGVHDAEKTGSLAGALHRGWINLKSAISSKDEHAILSECERGEDAVVAEYRKALEAGKLPAHIADVVREQSIEIKATHDHVRALRDSLITK